VKNSATDNSYDLKYQDGRIHKFDQSGKLLWMKDRNGNQTTLSYDPTSGFLTGITDGFGRSLAVAPNANGTIHTISDSLGVVATYVYNTDTTIQNITYQDGSMYKFEYDIAGGKTVLKTVKD